MTQDDALSSTDQRSLHLRRSQGLAQRSKSLDSIVDEETGILRADLLEERNCAVCDSPSRDFLFAKAGGHYHRCRECGLIYLNPVLTDLELERYYRRNSTTQAQSHQSEMEFYRRIYGGGMNIIQSHFTSGLLLDIGCSSGLFLEQAREVGFEVVGLELNADEAEMGRAANLDIREIRLEELRLGQRFDVITLWDVFEHIKDPHQYLEMLRNVLAPCGIVFIQIPNPMSLSARIMRERCNMFDGVEHVNLYGMDTLLRLMELNAYDVLFARTVIDDLGPLRNYLSFEPPYTGSFNNESDLNFLTPELLFNSNLGYKIQAVVRPRSS